MNRALQGAVRCLSGPTPWYREKRSGCAAWWQPDGNRVIRDEIRGPWQGEALGHTLAQRLLAAGADVILRPRSTGHECSTGHPVRWSSARSAPDGPLVVRPAAQANQLVQTAAPARSSPLCCPLLETRPDATSLHLGDMLPQTDLVIAVSIHAVHFAHHFLLQTGQTWPHIDYFAVGQASADAFSRGGHPGPVPG